MSSWNMTICRTAGRLCVFGGLCVDMWCDDWYTNGHFCCFDCFLTVFDRFDCTNRQKQSKPLVYAYQSSQVYQDCTNSVPIVKNSQKTAKTAKNDHWCTNRHITCLHRVRRIHKVCVRVRRIHKADYSIENIYSPDNGSKHKIKEEDNFIKS